MMTALMLVIDKKIDKALDKHAEDNFLFSYEFYNYVNTFNLACELVGYVPEFTQKINDFGKFLSESVIKINSNNEQEKVIRLKNKINSDLALLVAPTL